jgi:hypothetical protein
MAEARKGRTLLLGLLLNFFFSSNFFSPELKISEVKFLETQSSQEKKGPGLS